MFAKIQRVHFVGIGGIGMSGIAEVLLTLGYKVSGSDLKLSPVTQRLARLGATIFEGHRAENVEGSEVVVTSSAVSESNPEVAAARKHHVPVIQRAEMLAELMRLKYGIAVAGMHGKTTTTSMVAAVLAAGGLDPTIIVGGRIDAMDSNARLGKSHYLVAEADESDRSFLKLSPIISVVTNIDREHMDCYRDMQDVEQTFLDFMDRVPFYGMLVICNDDERLRALLPRIRRRVVTYGTREGSDFQITGSTPLEVAEKPTSRFAVRYRGRSLGDFSLHVPGAHNVLNATAAVAVGIGLDIGPYDIRSALDKFRGVDRRFQLKGKVNGISVVDDYGHHPTEIRATLAAARQWGHKRIHVIFQPHRYTRTQQLMEEFTGAFGDADVLYILDIYAASEQPIEGVTGEALARAVAQRSGKNVRYLPSFAEATEAVAMEARDGDLILTLGAGNISQLGSQILERLAPKPAGEPTTDDNHVLTESAQDDHGEAKFEAFVGALLAEDLKKARGLLAAGVEINGRNRRGWTPLHFAVENRLMEAAKFLLEQGANPNQPDVNGWTPLHLAIDSESVCALQEYVVRGISPSTVEVTSLLLKFGADPNAKANNGESPLAVAKSYQNVDAVNVLKQHGAKES
jgi:UDP-N-acetylmuramate--alanine ligase